MNIDIHIIMSEFNTVLNVNNIEIISACVRRYLPLDHKTYYRQIRQTQDRSKHYTVLPQNIARTTR